MKKTYYHKNNNSNSIKTNNNGHTTPPPKPSSRPGSKWYTIDVKALPLKLAYFIYGFHRMSYKPFLIVFFTSIGLNKAEAGLLVGLMPLGSILGNPFWGIIADKTKRHRTILIIQFLGAMTLMSLQPFVAKFLGNPVTNQCPLVKMNHTAGHHGGEFENASFSGGSLLSPDSPWINGSTTVAANRFTRGVNLSEFAAASGVGSSRRLVRSVGLGMEMHDNNPLPQPSSTNSNHPGTSSKWRFTRALFLSNTLSNKTNDHHRVHVNNIETLNITSDANKPSLPSNHSYLHQDSQEAQEDREKTLTDREHKLLFTVLLAMIVLQDFFQGSYLSFTESAAIRYIDMQPYRMDYGFQRMVSGPGAALGVPMVNLWLELMAKFGWSFSMSCYVTMHAQYTVASLLYLSVLLFLYTRISPSVNGYESIDDEVVKNEDATINYNQRSPKSCESGLLNNSTKSPQKNEDREGEKVSSIHIAIFRKLTQPQMVFLMVTLLLSGVSLTLFSSFTMAYLIELGAPRTLLSLAYSTALMSLMLGYFFSTRLIAFFKGPWNVFSVGLAAYSVRYLMYGFMRNPWLVLSVQPLHLLCRAVLNAAAITYMRDVTSPEILTSVYAIMDSVQTGVGWIVGNSFGGYVYHLYGGRVLYVSVACLDLLWVFVIFIFSRRSKLFKSPSSSKVLLNGHKNHDNNSISS